MNRPRTECGRAFTLAESLLAAAVLVTAISAVVLPFAAGARSEQVDARMTLAVCLAQEMMEEILSKPFNDPDGASLPGPETGESKRSRFDNIDDYHGYYEGPGQIADSMRKVVTTPSAEGLSRSVTAQYVYVSGQDVTDPPDFIRVTVTIRHRGVELVKLTRLVYNTPRPGGTANEAAED